jgi:GPH family glycoside/pentoside/hexuronide:cation symporter
LAFFIGGGFTGVYMIGWAMIADCVEVDEFKTGQRREGLYFGFISFIQKGGCALAMWILGVALSWVGYVPDAPQTEGALMGIRSIYGLVGAGFLLLSIVLCYFMPMTREKHQALCEAIRLKKEGKEYDEAIIADIIR